MADDRHRKPPPTLDYGIEEPQRLRRRDSVKYYREPPPLTRLTPGAVLLWVVSFVVAAVLFLWSLLHSMPVIR